MRKSLMRFGFVIVGICAAPWAAFASNTVDSAETKCPGYGYDLPMNNSQVLHWKRTTSNQYRDRGHVVGVIQKIYPNRGDHLHWEVKIGPKDQDTIEVIYNKHFGAVPQANEGMEVEVCGDYITSYQATPLFPASPDGALIHWVHKNPKGTGHPSGFLKVDGVLYGQMGSSTVD